MVTRGQGEIPLPRGNCIDPVSPLLVPTCHRERFPGGGEGIGSLRSGLRPDPTDRLFAHAGSPNPRVLIPSAGFYDYTLYSKLYTLVR